MLFALMISIFFGVVAAAAMLVNGVMIQRGIHAARAIRAELASMDQIGRSSAPVLQGRLAYA